MNKKTIAEITLVLVLLPIGAAYMEYSDKGLGANGEITRNEYGEGSRQMELILDASPVANEYSYTLTVDEVNLTEDEARALFFEAKQEIDDTFAGEGDTVDHITGDVRMEESYADGKVGAEWSLSSYAYLDYDGSVKEETIPEDGVLLTAEVVLSCGAYTEEYTFSFMLYPRNLSETEALIEQIDMYFTEEQSKEGEETLTLPVSINGIALQWKEAGEHLTVKVILLEVFLVLMIPLVQYSRTKEREKKRSEEILLDYPEMVSKFNVLVGAGMSIKQTWHMIAAQYSDKREKGTVRESIVFEEMVRTDREIRDGESERSAYQRFGERMRNSSYRRLVRLLVNNLQKGNRGLCEQLEQEAETAFAERRMLAKRLGEEAGTKLLLPMLMMLGIVMVIVVVPAVAGFSV